MFEEDAGVQVRSEEDAQLTRIRTLPGQLVAIGFGLALFTAIGSLAWPLGDDQEIFSWVGRVILDGGAPYKDAWDIKGPLVYYIYAFAIGVFGNHEISIRLVDLIILVACCAILRKLSLRINGNSQFGSDCATIFLVFAYYGWGTSQAAQPDGWASMLVLLVTFLLLGSQRAPTRTMALVGGILGLAALLKQHYTTYLLLPLLFPVGTLKRPLDRIWRFAPCLMTFLLVITGAMLMLVLLGAFDAFLDVFRFLASYVPRKHSLAEIPDALLGLAKLGLLIPLLLVPLGIRGMVRARLSREAKLLALWSTLALFGVIAQGRYWPYHWMAVVIAVAPILAAVFGEIERRWLDGTRVRVPSRVLAFLFCLLTLGPLGAHALSVSYEWPQYVLGLHSKEQYVRNLTAPWDYWPLERLSTYMSEHSSAEDYVLMWSWDPLIHALPGRRSPTRFAESYFLVAAGSQQARFRQIFMAEINARRPRYIVIDTQKPWSLLDKSGLELLETFPEFSAFLHSRYQLIDVLDRFQIWMQTSASANATSLKRCTFDCQRQFGSHLAG